MQLTELQLEVAAIITAPEHRIGLAYIDFVIDTGCDISFLSFADINKINLPQNTLKFEQHTYIGGSSWDIKEMRDVRITFENEKGEAEKFELKKFHAALPTRISAKEMEHAEHMPSILGLDFLIENGLSLHINPAQNDYYFERP